MTLDDDVALKIGRYIKKTGKSAKEVYNDLLRMALTEKQSPSKESQPFKLEIFHGTGGLMPGFSWDMSFAQIADKLDEMDWSSRDSSGH